MTQKGQTFVYGNFLWLGMRNRAGGFYGEVQTGEPDVAVEILREFGASEFVGKLYLKPSGSWTIARIAQIREMPWYRVFEDAPQMLVFDMQGSGAWEVLHFRTESDEFGGYFAIALRQFAKGKVPHWVKTARVRTGRLSEMG